MKPLKFTLKIFSLFIILSTVSCVLTQQIPGEAPATTVSLQLFYDQLSPYGQWMNYPNYGYAWRPSVDQNFMPYSTSGHWELTDDGETWVSDYQWGWAAFHYGRWFSTPEYGWMWLPDTQWGPAWVTWRQTNDYYGWTPMRPHQSIPKSYNKSSHVPGEHWVFVKQADITKPNVSNYYVDHSQNTTIIKNSTVIKNTYIDKSRKTTYVSGPRKEDLQKVANPQPKQLPIQQTDKPTKPVVNNNGKLQVYQPKVTKKNNDGTKPVPSPVIKVNKIKPAPPRNEVNQIKNSSPADNNSQNTNQKETNPKKIKPPSK